MVVAQGYKVAWPIIKNAGKKAGPYVLLAVQYLQNAENREKLTSALSEARSFIKEKGITGGFQRTKSRVKEAGSNRRQKRIACAVVSRMSQPEADLESIGQDVLLLKTAAVKPLCSQLENANKAVRTKAAQLLGEIADVESIIALIKASGDPEPEVRTAIESAIRNILKAHESDVGGSN